MKNSTENLMTAEEKINEIISKINNHPELILSMIFVGRNYSKLDLLKDLNFLKKEMERKNNKEKNP